MGPCCLDQLCTVLDEVECESQGGIVGYCIDGEPCGAVSCDAGLIEPVHPVRVDRTAGGTTLHLSWPPDPNADTYTVCHATSRSDILGPAPGPGNPSERSCAAPMELVPEAAPTTVPEAVHSGAISGTQGEIFYYNVIAGCTQVAGEVGACCDPSDQSCTQQSEADCLAAGGRFQGAGNECPPQPCELGACCDLMTGDCLEAVDGTICRETLGLSFAGPGTACASDPCITGACCGRDDLACAEEVAWECEGELPFDRYLGDGTLCEPSNPCPESFGACCDSDAFCQRGLREQECIDRGGTFMGLGVLCSEVACEGACCNPGGGPCQEFVSEDECAALGGDFAGPDTTCGACGSTGACCAPDGTSCIDDLERDLCSSTGGHFAGPGVLCDEIDCALGACCDGAGGCSDVPEPTCDLQGGIYQGPGTDCASTTCP